MQSTVFTIDELCYSYLPNVIESIEQGRSIFQNIANFKLMEESIEDSLGNVKYDFNWEEFKYRIGLPYRNRENIWIELPKHGYAKERPLYLLYLAFNAEYVSPGTTKITYVLCMRDLQHQETYIGRYIPNQKIQTLLHIRKELTFEDFRKYLLKQKPFGRSFKENLIHKLLGAEDLEN